MSNTVQKKIKKNSIRLSGISIDKGLITYSDILYGDNMALNPNNLRISNGCKGRYINLHQMEGNYFIITMKVEI